MCNMSVKFLSGRKFFPALLVSYTSLDTQRVSKKWFMWKCAILIYNCSIFSTTFYMILKITKLALIYRLFYRICFWQSRDQDMFD